MKHFPPEAHLDKESGPLKALMLPLDQLAVKEAASFSVRLDHLHLLYYILMGD